MEFLNIYVVPLVLCWSLGGIFSVKLYLFQCTFTLLLSLWVGYKIVFNQRRVEHFYIDLGNQQQLSHYSNLFAGGKLSGSEATSETDPTSGESNHFEPEVSFTISSRSRYTQFCLFLFLRKCHPSVRNKNANYHPSKDDGLIREKNSVSQKFLFKWQMSEGHYRTLTSTILRNMKETT